MQKENLPETGAELENPSSIQGEVLSGDLEKDQNSEGNNQTPEDDIENDPKFQEKLDKALQKRLGREKRKLERENAIKLQEERLKYIPRSNGEVDPEQYSTSEEYVEALAASKADKIIQKREQERQNFEFQKKFSEREEAAREKFDDYDEVVDRFNSIDPKTLSKPIVETIYKGQRGPEIAYHLAKDVNTLIRISSLPEFEQGIELYKLQLTLDSNKQPVKTKVSNAPSPISPVGGSVNQSMTETLDPRSVSKMSPSEYINARRQQQLKKAKS